MKHEIKFSKDGSHIDATLTSNPDVYLHFGHHDFDIVWNEQTNRQEVVRGVNKYFGGMGEGSSFSTWQEALLASLYDAHQVYPVFKDGDTVEAAYKGETASYRVESFHVIPCRKDWMK